MAPPDALSSAIPAQPDDPAQDRTEACAPGAEEAARLHALRMQALEALIGDGLALLDEIKRRALRTPYEVEEEHKPEPAELGLAFDRISRAVRFTVAQHERLEAEAGKTAEQKHAEAAARAAAEAARAARARNAPSPEALVAKREQDHKLRLVERAVKGAICDFTEDYDERDELTGDLNERLEEREDLGLDRPIGAVVAGICRAMRLPFDFALWEDEPWALQEAAEKPKGSPYAKWRRSANDTFGDDDDPYATVARRGVGPP
jgi:hypothetical protein